MDAQGGEKIEIMCELYGILIEDAYERDVYCEEYYTVNGNVLNTFKKFQGFSEDVTFPGGSLLQARLIWSQPQMDVFNAVVRANEFSDGSEPIPPGVTVHGCWPD
jgi:hypothetical protein